MNENEECPDCGLKVDGKTVIMRKPPNGIPNYICRKCQIMWANFGGK